MKNTGHWKAYAPTWLPTPALVANVELSHAITPITLGPNYRAARLLVRVHDQPIGYVDIVARPDEVIDRTRIFAAMDRTTADRALAYLLPLSKPAALNNALPTQPQVATANQLAMSQSGGPKGQRGVIRPLVTVAICTRDRPDSIAATLDSLVRQTYPNVEILVVDNAPSTNATERFVSEKYPNTRYVLEPHPGLDWARNRAVFEAHGELLAYIDDDATADPHWLERVVAAFDAPEVMCMTGFVAPLRLDNAAQELFERFGYSKGFYRLDFNLRTPPPEPLFPYKGYHGTGCNSAFRRSVFQTVGLFDPRLDMGTPVPGGGDHDMFTRIIMAGHTLRYEPTAVVYHDHIDDISVLPRKLGQYHQAFVAYLTKYALLDPSNALPLLFDTAWSYVRKFVRGLAAVAVKHDRPVAMVFTQAFYPILGPLALYRSHRKYKSSGVQYLPSAIVAAEVELPTSDELSEGALVFDKIVSKDHAQEMINSTL